MKEGAGRTYFSVIVGVRVMYGLVSAVADCDEVFNYWEPAHQLIYKRGLQTWEYSPEFGLRSWLYIWLNCSLGWVLGQAGVSKTTVFMATRSFLALCSGYADCALLTAVNAKLGGRLSFILGALLACATGCNCASFCFLPSSFTLMCMSVAVSQQMCFAPGAFCRCVGAIVCVAVAVLVGWPFVGLAFVPMALHALAVYSLPRPLFVLLTTTVVLAALVTCIDTQYYGRPVMSTWEIVKYNVLGCLPNTLAARSAHAPDSGLEHVLRVVGCIREKGGGQEARGSHLYGVEDWTFFFKNLFLNFNIAFLAALVAPLVLVLRSVLLPPPPVGTRPSVLQSLWYILPFYLWFGFWLLIPHKEERFMAPVYSLLCLAAAMGVDAAVDVIDCLGGAKGAVLQGLKDEAKQKTPCTAPDTDPAPSRPGRLRFAWGHSTAGKVFLAAFVTCFAGLCVSRGAALTNYYGAPLEVMYKTSLIEEFEGIEPGTREQLVTLCLGREWYRFMSHFFVPESVRVAFVDDGFRGLLPKYFGTDGTASVPPGMNDVNRMDPAQFVRPDTCDYLLTSEFPSDAPGTPIHRNETAGGGPWNLVEAVPLLDPLSTPLLHRAFTLPSFVPGAPVYGRLMLMRKMPKKQPKEAIP